MILKDRQIFLIEEIDDGILIIAANAFDQIRIGKFTERDAEEATEPAPLCEIIGSKKQNLFRENGHYQSLIRHNRSSSSFFDSLPESKHKKDVGVLLLLIPHQALAAHRER